MNIRSVLATAMLLLLTSPVFATTPAASIGVPELSTWALFGIGAVALGVARSRRKK